MIYTHLCETWKTAFQGGTGYFMKFIGDYIRWQEVVFIKSKSGASNKIQTAEIVHDMSKILKEVEIQNA